MGIIIAVLLIALSVPAGIFILIEYSKSVIETAKEGNTEEFGEGMKGYFLIAIIVMIIAVISTIVIAILKKAG